MTNFFRGRLSNDEDCRLQTGMKTLMKTPSTSEGEFVSAPTSADYVFHRVLKLNRSEMARNPRNSDLYRFVYVYMI